MSIQGKTLHQTSKERSAAFQAAIDLRDLVLDLSGDGEHIATIHAAYLAARPLLEPLRLRQLKPKDYDQRFLELLQHYIIPYHHIVSQHSDEYWENLRALGGADDFPEFQMLRIRKHDLAENWKAVYSKKKKGQSQAQFDEEQVVSAANAFFDPNLGVPHI